MNLTYPLYNIGWNNSFIKYRLPYDMKEFFEIRFRFISHQLEQKNGLIMFINGQVLNESTTGNDFISLVYEQKTILFHLNLGQEEKVLRTSIEANITEQMVLFGRFHQTFWLLVIPAHLSSTDKTQLVPQVGRMAIHHRYLNVDPYLYVGGHDDWQSHSTLANLVGFKGNLE